MRGRRLRFAKEEEQLFRYVVLIALMIILSYTLVVFLLGTKHFLITIESNSMEPTFYRGDVVIVKKENNYQQGDIIAFLVDSEIYVHRIVAAGEQYRTKGDRNVAPDLFLVERQNILGKVVFIVPKLGYINLWLAGK
jgi:signal peptidase